jgi:hypothetical protein
MDRKRLPMRCGFAASAMATALAFSPAFPWSETRYDMEHIQRRFRLASKLRSVLDESKRYERQRLAAKLDSAISLCEDVAFREWEQYLAAIHRPVIIDGIEQPPPKRPYGERPKHL